MSTSTVYRFGPFWLSAASRMLFSGDQPVPLGSRAMDLLLALVDRPAEAISHAELMAVAWPDCSVDQSTLRFHIASLRRKLGRGSGHACGYISSISGRGYCFVSAVSRSTEDAVPRRRQSHSTGPALDLVGREAQLEELGRTLPLRRMVTIVGAGGMGKSALASAFADRWMAQYPSGVHLLDVSTITDPAHLAPTLATQLGMTGTPAAAHALLRRWLKGQHALVMLDGCEAQLDACAHLARGLLEQAPQLHVLATSREAMNVPGEWVLHLGPLALPEPPWQQLSLDDAQSHAGIRLLLDRARAAGCGLEVLRANVAALCDIARRLDGMPLAIDLAAVQLAALDPADLLHELRDRHLLHVLGRRTPASRHRTLGALLDWSYERLSRVEQLVLCRLAACGRDFDLAAALQAACDRSLRENEVIEALSSLASKSLIAVRHDGRSIRYQLLEVTRAYARHKHALATSPFSPAAAGRVASRAAHPAPPARPGAAYDGAWPPGGQQHVLS